MARNQNAYYHILFTPGGIRVQLQPISIAYWLANPGISPLYAHEEKGLKFQIMLVYILRTKDYPLFSKVLLIYTFNLVIVLIVPENNLQEQFFLIFKKLFLNIKQYLFLITHFCKILLNICS